ncbi:MAG: IclR family transcriptional regulator [Burkholderiaceae bacterium]|jgi:DNA-binding IclR family transcriptional regulator|nr:IclR family transcriptional regulator [Burkholderiaceae bacterium]
MKNSAQGSQTVARAMGVLRLVSSHAKEGMRVQDIVDAGELSRPTVHRLLTELVECGLLMRSSQRRYFLGQFAYELGISAASHFHLREICEPFLERVALETGDTAFLVARSGADSFCLDRKSGSFPVKVFTVEVGSRQPLGVGAAGLAILSWLPVDAFNQVMERNAALLPKYAGLSLERLQKAVAHAQEIGYSKIADFAVPGVSGVGMPVLDPAGHPVVALSVATVTARMSPEHEEQVVKIIRHETSQLRNVLLKHKVAVS